MLETYSDDQWLNDFRMSMRLLTVSVTNCRDNCNAMRVCVCVKLLVELQAAVVFRILMSEDCYPLYTLADRIWSHSLLR